MTHDTAEPAASAVPAVIGLIGGMSWESSAVYYRDLNRGVEQRLGGLHSARLLLASVDFAEVDALQEAERWDDVAAVLVEQARGLERAGADFVLLCTTTFHRVAEQVQAAIGVPLLHLADVVADAARAAGLTTVALVGTRFAMERTFFTERLERAGLKVTTPPAERHAELDRIVYEELVHGRVRDESRRWVVEVLDALWQDGAEGVVLGCTELELLVHQADTELRLLPCTTLHVAAALERALGGGESPGSAPGH